MCNSLPGMHHLYLNELPNVVPGDRFIPVRHFNCSHISLNSLAQYHSTPVIQTSLLSERDMFFKSLLRNEVLNSKIHNLQVKNRHLVPVDSKPHLFTYSLDKENIPHYTGVKWSLRKESKDLFNYHSLQSKYNISQEPVKILDAPRLRSDFYMHLLDWSCKNLVAVGLEDTVYLWPFDTQVASAICTLPGEQVTVVSWHTLGDLLTVASRPSGSGEVKVTLWDVRTGMATRSLQGHHEQVNVCAWNNNVLTSGGQQILLHDVRAPDSLPTQVFRGQNDICGLQWSPSKSHLASGSNDNSLCVWDHRTSKITQKHQVHVSAVRALAWSPHHRGLLLSGGGRFDRSIRLWNIHTAKQLDVINTSSQVCNLLWSRYSNDFLSTHGVPESKVVMWNHTHCIPVAEMSGHTGPVLYVALSPDGSHIATAGGEDLRIWAIWIGDKKRGPASQSKLSLTKLIR